MGNRKADEVLTLDAMMGKLNAKNDAELCRAPGVQPPLICKIRCRNLSVSSGMLIRMHEMTGLTIHELRDLMGDRRAIHRIRSRRFFFQKDEIAASVNKPRRGLL